MWIRLWRENSNTFEKWIWFAFSFQIVFDFGAKNQIPLDLNSTRNYLQYGYSFGAKIQILWKLICCKSINHTVSADALSMKRTFYTLWYFDILNFARILKWSCISFVKLREFHRQNLWTLCKSSVLPLRYLVVYD